METAELDVALEELELRLERLRALYEQYFMGLEKIEPAIARKDVDRRIYVLRREKIRNTAKRFKLQTIIQRYNTFQQYWQRICREIENGTYKRHLLKIQKNGGQLLTIAARKRLGRGARASQPPEGKTASEPPLASPSPPVAPASAPTPAPAAPPAAVATPAAAVGASAPTAAFAAPAAAPLAAKPAAPAKPSPPAKPAPAKFENLDLDMDFMGDWDPQASRGPAARPAASPPKPTARPTSAAPRAAPPARPAPMTAPPTAALPRPASSQPPVAPARPLTPRTPPSPRIPSAPPKPVARPAAAAPKSAVPPPAAPPKPAAAAAAAPKPAAPAKPAAPKPAPSEGSNVDDARLRDLHLRLQQAKQQTKEANVSYEGLARSIRAAEAKLREQHKNRKIEFDVVIKDGKAIVKPIVR